MSDFDISLIREFRSRPAFYDRTSPLFKDKALNAQAWQEISNILGYDVALLKDRMLQLRNRYNLEKRRLEQLAEENPGKYAHSPWPLFEHLGFLSEHIRSRRSFKRMLPRQSSTDANMSRGVHLSSPALESSYAAAPLANGMCTVKLENTTDSESDSRSSTDLGPNNDDHDESKAGVKTSNSINVGSRDNDASSQSTRPLTPPHAFQQQPISIRSLDSMRKTIPKRKMHSYANNGRAFGCDDDNEASRLRRERKRSCLSVREEKYEAFGNFVASSLEEMPKKQALLLVERFTSEMVRVLIEKNVVSAVRKSSDSSASTAMPTATNNTNNNSSIGNNCSEETTFQKPQQQQQRKIN